MAGKNLKVALEITADLNQARREVGNFRDEIVKTTKAADSATNTQDKMAQSAGNATGQIQQMSKATDMKSSVNELKAFEKQLDLTAEASSKVAASNSIVEKSVKTLAPHFLALTAASGGFVAMAVDTLNKAAELQNLSSVTGLNVEQFQYSAAAAKTVGIEVDKLSQIFQDSRDKVGDYLAEGGGELQQFFDEIAPKVGVTAKQFEKLNGDQILQLYVKTLQEAGVSQNEMVTHMERLASDSTLLIPIYENNAAALKEIGDKAKASGAILSQELVDDAKKAKLALGEFTNELTGVSNQMIANAAPAITFLAENLDVLAQAGIIVTSVYVGRLAPAVIASTQATVAELTVKGRALFMSKARATALVAEATSAQAKTAAELRSAQAAMAVVASGSAQTAAQARLTAARAADTAAILAQTRAQSILDTTVSRSRITAGALIGALGGPVGLAVTAAGVAASFLLMRDSSNSVVDGFDIQKTSADELIEKYKELNSESKQTYLFKLTEQLEDNEKAIKSAADALDQFLLQKMNSIVGLTPEARKAIVAYFNDLKAGGDQAKTAFDKLKNTELLKQNELAKIAELGQSFKTASDETEKTRQKIDILNGASQSLSISTTSATNASNKLTDQLGSAGNAASKTAGEIINLSKEYKEYLKTTRSGNFSNLFELAELQSGKSEAQAKARVDAYNLKNSDPNANQTYFVTEQELALIDAKIQSEKKITEFKEQQRKLEEAKTKQLEKQAKFSDLKIKSSEATAGGRTHQGTIELAKFVQDNFNIRHFSAFNDQYHQGKGGKHPQGLAFDFSLRDPKESQSVTTSLKRTLAELGVNAGIQDEYKNPSKNATGGHIHVSFATAAEAEKFMAMTKTENKMKFVGEDLQDFRKQTQQQLEEQKRKDDEQKSIQEKYYTEDQKSLVDHLKNREAILKAGFDREKELELLLAEDKRFIADKNKERLELLKEVQNELLTLDQNYLKANGQEAQAELEAIDAKYKDLKDKIETLLQTATTPAEKFKLQDAQLKLNVVIDKEKITAEFNSVIDQLEKLQSLRQQRQDTLKLQHDSGQLSQFQFADGLNAIDAEMKPAMQSLIDQASILASKMGDAFSLARVEAMNAALNATDGSFQKFLPTVEQIQERIAGGMTDAILDWADGTKSASDAFRQFASDFLREIAQMILKQMIFNAVKAASSAFGFAEGGFTGFASGGYTGAGGKYDPAGIVHKGEVVWSQEDIKAWGGVGVVESMRKHRGYAEGGIVSAPAAQIPSIQMPSIQAPQLNDNAAQIAQSTSFNASQNFYLVDDPKRILDTLNSSQGQENIVVMMSRDPSKFKAALKIGG